MTYEELIENTLNELFKIESNATKDELNILKRLREAWLGGLQWGKNHPDFNFGCVNRVWHYLNDDPSDLPAPYKACLIKFSDGTGGISSTVPNVIPKPFDPSGPGRIRGKDNGVIADPVDSGTGSDDGDGDSDDDTVNNLSIKGYKWVTRYRDDIVAWSYYIDGFNIKAVNALID